MSQRARAAVALFLAVGIAAALRLVPAPEVFEGDRVLFLPDGDPYYHVLRATELAREGSIPWFDTGMNFPVGAEIPWPPLFDAAIVAAGWIAGAGTPTPEAIQLGAAVLPVVLGAALVLLLAALSRELAGPGVAIPAAFAAAAFGWHVDVGLVGRPDQHVAELLLLAGMLLAWARAVRTSSSRTRLGGAVALGLLVALAFWTWLGSALHVLLLASLAGAWHVLAPAGPGRDRLRASLVLAVAAATAAPLLALSAAVAGPPGALSSFRITGMSALPAFLTACVAASSGLLAAAARAPIARPWWWRVGEVAVAATIPLWLVLLAPPVRDGVTQGLAALGRTNPWYATIREFQPVLGSGLAPLGAEAVTLLRHFGLVPLVAVGGLFALPAVARAHPDRRFGVFALALGFAVLAVAAASRARFGPYLGVFGVVLTGVAARAVASRAVHPRARAALAGIVVAIAVAPSIVFAFEPRTPRGIEAVLRLARGIPSRVEAGVAPGGVLAAWTVGHHIRFASGLPVLMTPFGTEGGPGALEDGFAWYLAAAPASTATLEARRGIRWILLQDPIPEVALASLVHDLPPDRAPARLVRDVAAGPGIVVAPGLERLVSVRLFYADGVAAGTEALSRYRLVDEEPDPAAGAPVAKLFEVVPGARVRVTGAAPGEELALIVEVSTRTPRTFTYRASARADAGGTAELDVPYATGRNGAALASRAVVVAGARRAALVIPEEAVASAGVLEVALGSSAAH